MEKKQYVAARDARDARIAALEAALREITEDQQACSWEDDNCWVHDFGRPCPIDVAARALHAGEPAHGGTK